MVHTMQNYAMYLKHTIVFTQQVLFKLILNCAVFELFNVLYVLNTVLWVEIKHLVCHVCFTISLFRCGVRGSGGGGWWLLQVGDRFDSG